jgi:hypothetical protein
MESQDPRMSGISLGGRQTKADGSLTSTHRLSEDSDEGRLLWSDVASLQPLGAALNRKLHGLAFLQCAVTFHLDGGMMNENVLTALLRQEPVPFGGIEPLDGTSHALRHGGNSFL